jgi:hypothetical protein
MDESDLCIEQVAGGWHALSRSLNLAVWGATEDEARERFEVAARKAAEIRARPHDAAPSSRNFQGS